jgi:hypothetical protein
MWHHDYIFGLGGIISIWSIAPLNDDYWYGIHFFLKEYFDLPAKEKYFFADLDMGVLALRSKCTYYEKCILNIL